MKKIVKKVIKFFADVKNELQKVSWPTKKTVINHTIIVLVSSAVVMIVVSILDFGLSTAFEYFLSLNKG